MVRKACRKDQEAYFVGWSHERLLATFKASGYDVRSASKRVVTVAKGDHSVDIPFAFHPRYIWPQVFWAKFRTGNDIRIITLGGHTTFKVRA